jgi:hypothetical protein
LICHNEKEICVDYHAVDAHLKQGDYLGECDKEPDVSLVNPGK